MELGFSFLDDEFGVEDEGGEEEDAQGVGDLLGVCLLYTSPSPRDA